MARQATIKFYRGTRTAFNALVAANGLIDGEPYWITDEDLLVVGTGTNTYQEYSKKIITGNDSNGYYEKFPNGITRAWLPLMLVDHVADTGKTTNWTLPAGAGFINVNSMAPQVQLSSVGSTYGFVQKYLSCQPTSTTNIEIRAEFNYTQNYRFSLFCTGRWA